MIDVGAAIITTFSQLLLADKLIVGDPSDLVTYPVVVSKNNCRPMYDNSNADQGRIVVYGFSSSGMRNTYRQDKFEGIFIVQVQSPKDMKDATDLEALIHPRVTCRNLSSDGVKVQLCREIPNATNPLTPKEDMFWRNTTFRILGVRL